MAKKNTKRYLEFINFGLGASGVVRQNLQNSNAAFQAAETDPWREEVLAGRFSR